MKLENIMPSERKDHKRPHRHIYMKYSEQENLKRQKVD